MRQLAKIRHTSLVTGVAGFIGFYLCQKLLSQGNTVVGLDNLNDYYDVKLKCDRLQQLGENNNFSFYKLDLVQLCISS